MNHGRQAIELSAENEKQRFTRSGNLYGELDALRMAGP